MTQAPVHPARLPPAPRRAASGTFALSSRRAFIAYLAAWWVLGFAYLSALPDYPGLSFSDHLVDALVNLVPPAALGLIVIAACGRIAWMRPSGPLFAATHALLAVLYSIAWMLAMAIWTELRGLDVNKFSTLVLGSGPNRWQVIQGIVVYFVIAGLSYAYSADLRSREQASRADRAEMLRSQAELAMLRAQLNPHFIFNTLHSVHALVRRDPAAAQSAVEQLGDLLRYALAAKTGAHDDVSLSQEWAFVLTYLELERLRLGDRLRIDAVIAADAGAAIVPAFTLQPLVENAIKHAIAPSVAGGTLTIRATIDIGRVHLRVEDDGTGAAPVAPSTGVGLSLVRRRLHERYAGDASLQAAASERGFAVRIDLPLVTAAPP